MFLQKSKFGNALADPGNQRRILCLVALAMIILTYGSRLWLLQTRAFDNDEFEHMHSAWLISKDFLPFRDYFEHHTPLLHFALAVIIPFYDADLEFTEARKLLLSSRLIMWVLSGIIVLLTFQLGKIWKNWRIGILAATFLIWTVMFQEKTLEIRPDLIAIPCWLGCLLLLLKMMKGDNFTNKSKNWLIAASGFLLGTSIMATQKMLFAMPGFTLAMFVYWFSPGSKGTIFDRFTQILCQLAGFFLPMLLTIGYFALHQSAYAFIEYNLLLNLGWKIGFSPFEYILRLLDQNPFLVGMGLLGLILCVGEYVKTGVKSTGNYHYLLIINLIGLLVGLFLIPVPWRQYYLMFLPLLAIFAADTLIQTVDGLIQVKKLSDWNKFISLGIFCILFAGAMLIWTLPAFGDIQVLDLAKKLILLGAILLSFIPIFLGYRDLAIAVLILALHLPTVKKFTGKFNSSNQEQLNSIRYVIENTGPQDTFMDGWQGVGLFRPHAYFYWMLHVEIRHMISAEEKDQLLRDLESGKIKPALVNLDNDLRELSPEITAFITNHYEPVDVGFIHKRKSGKE